MIKIKNILLIYALCHILFLSKIVLSEDIFLQNISKYINQLSEFKCSFIQYSPDGSISEGNMIYSKNKIKINYLKPSLITFVAREKKAMYFNEDLLELHYFNPDKTAFSLFKNLFNLETANKELYTLKKKDGVVSLTFNQTNIEEISKFEVIFQNSQIELKKIKWSNEDKEVSVFSIYNIDTGVTINKKTFNMLNPIINN